MSQTNRYKFFKRKYRYDFTTKILYFLIRFAVIESWVVRTPLVAKRFIYTKRGHLKIRKRRVTIELQIQGRLIKKPNFFTFF